MFKIVSLFILGIGLSVFSVFNLKKSMDKTESIGYIKFLEGNRFIEENKIKEAIEEYKVALDNNGDVNIKKNYELALKSLENQQQQQNSSENNDKSENQEEKSNNNSDNNKNSEDSKDSENSQKEKGESSEKESQSPSGEQQQQNESQEGQGQKEQQKADELKSIMQRLESNEKKAFKNNERVLNKSENKDSENRW